MRKRRPSPRAPYRIGFLGTLALVSALLIFMYGTTFKSTEQVVFLSASVLLGLGLTLAFIMVGVRFEPFNFSFLFESILWTGLSFAMIWLINRYVPFKIDISPINARLFSVLMGVAEELFFRLWLCTFTQKITNSTILAVLISSGIWTSYHMARYGGEPRVLGIVFIAGVVLGIVMLKSRMADGVIFAHAIVNYLATA